MLRNCLSALLNSLSNNFSGEKDSPKRKRQKAVSYSRSLRFEPCEDRTMLSVSPFNSEDVTAHWTFNNNTEDTNGAFVGTLNNGASLTTNGIAGGGLSLDGVDDYFSIGDPEELQILNEITLAAWIVPETASGVQNIIAKGYSTHPNGEIFLRIANGKYQVGSWTGSEHLAEFVIPSSDIGERVHLAGTYDGTTWRLYRNGVEIASTVDNTGAVEVDGAWAVGARGTGTERFYKGVIDEVVISSTAYTAQEIAALASIPTNAQEDNSVTWNWSDVQSGELYSEQGDSLGTLSNGAYIQTDLNYGQVLNLSGNNGYVSLGNPDDLQIFGKITLSAWICPDSLTGIQNIIVKGYASNPDGEIFLRIANGEYQVGSWNGTNYYVSAIADTDDIGQWIQLTGVYDGDTWRLYKNCVEVASTSSSVGAVPVNANWTIGSSASCTDRFFNGKIGACGIYDHALDAQSVAALMSDSQTIARVGGNPYAIKDQSYVLQLDASSPNVIWTINWGDGTTEDYYNASSASHVYTHYGTSGVSVTAKRNGQTIDVQGSSIGLQIGSVDEMIINGNFEDVAIPNGTYWAIYDTISGWTGPVEIQINNGSKVAELDTDSRYSDLDPSESDHQPHHTSISSSPLSFTPGLTYTLSFDAWNRSDYAQDNILNVTVPGEIISVNGNTSVSTLLDLIDDNDLGAYSFTSISYNSVTFSTGGSYYETDDGNGGTVYTLGASPFHVSSITFVATSNSGSVSFSDVSSDVIPGYGPLLDNISMNQEYLYVDIDVDSNNDGVIDAFDDSIEMGNSQNTSIESGAYGYIVLAGEQFSVNLNTISSRLLDSSIYGVRLLDSAGILDFADPYLYQSTAAITAEQTGQTTLAYEIYLLGTNQVVARDEVLISVIDCEAFITVDENRIYENWEGHNIAEFTIELNQTQIVPVTVSFILSGDAEFESDYSVACGEDFVFDSETNSGSVRFLPGETLKTFCVSAIDDGLFDYSTLSGNSGSEYESDLEQSENVNISLIAGDYYRLFKPMLLTAFANNDSDPIRSFTSAQTTILRNNADLDISTVSEKAAQKVNPICFEETTYCLAGYEDTTGEIVVQGDSSYLQLYLRPVMGACAEDAYWLSWDESKVHVYISNPDFSNDPSLSEYLQIFTGTESCVFAADRQTVLYVQAGSETTSVCGTQVTADLCRLDSKTGQMILADTDQVTLHVIQIDLQISNAPVTGLGTVNEQEEDTIGAVTFPNWDNDDQDDKWDMVQGGIGNNMLFADNELSNLKFTIIGGAPLELIEGRLRLELGGTKTGKFWSSPTKARQLATSLQNQYSIPTSNSLWNHTETTHQLDLWIESLEAHQKIGNAAEFASYSFKISTPSGGMVEDTVKLTCVGIELVSWKNCNNGYGYQCLKTPEDGYYLDDDPIISALNGNTASAIGVSGKRVFPDDRLRNNNGAIEIDSGNNYVIASVLLSVPSPRPINIYLKCVDADDPSSSDPILDDENLKDDNRGSSLLFNSEQNILNKNISVSQDGSVITFYTNNDNLNTLYSVCMDVSMNPGDNYRLVAGFDEDFVNRLDNDESFAKSESQKQMITDSIMLEEENDNSFAEVPFSDKTCSEILTVWRFMNYEILTMKGKDNETEPIPDQSGLNGASVIDGENNETGPIPFSDKFDSDSKVFVDSLRKAYFEPIILEVKCGTIPYEAVTELPSAIRPIQLSSINILNTDWSNIKKCVNNSSSSIFKYDDFYNTLYDEILQCFPDSASIPAFSTDTTVFSNNPDNARKVNDKVQETIDKKIKNKEWNNLDKDELCKTIENAIEGALSVLMARPFLEMFSYSSTRYPINDSMFIASIAIVNYITDPNDSTKSWSGLGQKNTRFIAIASKRCKEIPNVFDNFDFNPYQNIYDNDTVYLWSTILHETTHLFDSGEDESLENAKELSLNVRSNNDLQIIIDRIEPNKIDVMNYYVHDILNNLITNEQLDLDLLKDLAQNLLSNINGLSNARIALYRSLGK